MTETEKPYWNWNVTLSINGESVLSIEPNELAGIPDIDKYRDQIIEAAHHLLAFIGTGEESGFEPDEESRFDAALREAFIAGQDSEAERQWRETRE